jgi:hypothetical protein
MQHIVFDVEDELFTLRERFDYVVASIMSPPLFTSATTRSAFHLR